MAREVDRYICSEFADDLRDPGTTNGIGYSREEGKKFATLTTARQRCLILHIGKREEGLGLEIQVEIDSMLGKKYNRTENDNKSFPHEAFIRLEWVPDIEYIKGFINKAYYKK